MNKNNLEGNSKLKGTTDCSCEIVFPVFYNKHLKTSDQ